MRAHLYLPVTNTSGDLYSSVSVRLLEPNTTTLIMDTIYGADSGAGVVAQPWVPASSIINCYLAYARRVRIGITPAGQGEYFLEDVDVRGSAGTPSTGATSLYLFDSSGTRWAVSVSTLGVLSTAVAP